jgi:hypothetical protein
MSQKNLYKVQMFEQVIHIVYIKPFAGSKPRFCSQHENILRTNEI